MSAPNLPRFVVASVTGYSAGVQGGKAPTTAYSVLDTWYAHREVASFYVKGGYAKGVGRANDAMREAQATARCAELEAWHARAMGT